MRPYKCYTINTGSFQQPAPKGVSPQSGILQKNFLMTTFFCSRPCILNSIALSEKSRAEDAFIVENRASKVQYQIIIFVVAVAVGRCCC
jgi:hypothetical protein